MRDVVVTVVGSGGVGPGVLEKAATLHAPCCQTRFTLSVAHDCWGSTVAPLPTMPTRQIEIAALPCAVALDAVADGCGSEDDDRCRHGAEAETLARLHRGLLVRGDEAARALRGRDPVDDSVHARPVEQRCPIELTDVGGRRGYRTPARRPRSAVRLVS